MEPVSVGGYRKSRIGLVEERVKKESVIRRRKDERVLTHLSLSRVTPDFPFTLVKSVTSATSVLHRKVEAEKLIRGVVLRRGDLARDSEWEQYPESCLQERFMPIVVDLSKSLNYSGGLELVPYRVCVSNGPNNGYPADFLSDLSRLFRASEVGQVESGGGAVANQNAKRLHGTSL